METALKLRQHSSLLFMDLSTLNTYLKSYKTLSLHAIHHEASVLNAEHSLKGRDYYKLFPLHSHKNLPLISDFLIFLFLRKIFEKKFLKNVGIFKSKDVVLDLKGICCNGLKLKNLKLIQTIILAQ